jgi:hypothetical protein
VEKELEEKQQEVEKELEANSRRRGGKEVDEQARGKGGATGAAV